MVLAQKKKKVNGIIIIFLVENHVNGNLIGMGHWFVDLTSKGKRKLELGWGGGGGEKKR